MATFSSTRKGIWAGPVVVLLLIHFVIASNGSSLTILQQILLQNQNPESRLIPVVPNVAAASESALRALSHRNLATSHFARAISDECLAHLYGWGDNLQTSMWSLRMLDAMSKIPEGILTGHTSSFGDFDECLATRAEIKGPDGRVATTFKGRHCTAYVVPESMCQTPPAEEPIGGQTRDVHTKAFLGPLFDYGIYPGVATCMPSSCSNADIQSFMNYAIAQANQAGACVRVNHCQTDDRPSLRAGDIAMIILLSVIAALCLIGTAIDLTLPKPADERGGTSARQSTAVQSILAFSLYTNTKKWLSTKGGGDNLGCIHGIRFLSTCWVVLAHTWTQWMEKVWNLTDLMNVYKDWTIYPIINGTLSVDTFFTVAGLLTAYNLLKLLDKTKGRLNVPMLYLHRFLRLTPTYAILIGIMATLFEYLKPGPHTYQLVNAGSSCRAHWWHNLLYINNIVKYDLNDAGNGMCHGESWYLGNDLQFFIISPLLLLPLWRWRVPGMILMGVFTVASVVIPFVITYIEKLEATLIVTALDSFEDFYTKSYIKPWMRFGSYVVGLWAGYLLYLARKSRTPIRLPRWVVIFGWLTSTAIALTIMFSVKPFFDPTQEYKRVASSLYAAIHRSGWGLVISWIVLACTMGYGGFINTFLSWKVFIPLGRLSFCVYLISYWLQSLYYFSARQAMSYDLYTGINHFFSHMVMSLMVSFVVCMTLESPFIALEKILFQQDKPKRSQSQLKSKLGPDTDKDTDTGMGSSSSENSINKTDDDNGNSVRVSVTEEKSSHVKV